MPDDEFDHVKFASGGCVIPTAWLPDCRCSGRRFEGYREVISGFEMQWIIKANSLRDLRSHPNKSLNSVEQN